MQFKKLRTNAASNKMNGWKKRKIGAIGSYVHEVRNAIPVMIEVQLSLGWKLLLAACLFPTVPKVSIIMESWESRRLF